MADPIILASSPAGHVELRTGHRSSPALDAKFVPASPQRPTQVWTSYVAWAVKDHTHNGWNLCVTPEFVTRGRLQQLPPLRAEDELAATAWLSLLAHSWLRLVETTTEGDA